jgi:prepilin-type N-terminal cleavage/methylation domain-containing protein
MMHNRGFTLLELMIAAAVLSIVSMLGFVAIQSATASMAISSAKADVAAELRDTMSALNMQLEYAAKTGNDALDPVLEEVSIIADPEPGIPLEIEYQTPIDDTGRNWSPRITLQYINEDLNGDGFLNGSEDLNDDGTLTRRFARLQDINDDGDTDDPGERMPLGGANHITNAQVARNGDIITVTLTASKFLGTRRTNPVTQSMTGRIYLLN